MYQNIKILNIFHKIWKTAKEMWLNRCSDRTSAFQERRNWSRSLGPPLGTLRPRLRRRCPKSSGDGAYRIYLWVCYRNSFSRSIRVCLLFDGVSSLLISTGIENAGFNASIKISPSNRRSCLVTVSHLLQVCRTPGWIDFIVPHRSLRFIQSPLLELHSNA